MMLAPSQVHLAVAALNQTVGDWAGNLARMERAVDQARGRGAGLVALPECAVSGYNLGDRLLHRGTWERAWEVLEALARRAEDIVVVVGLPVSWRGRVLNAAAVLAGGRVCGLVPKQHLATGDVEYESRWYTPWEPDRFEAFTTPSGQEVPLGPQVFVAEGVGRFAVEVCEDLWVGSRPGSVAALAGAEVVVNLSASWFVLGKHERRRRLVAHASQVDRCVYAYVSLLGCDATRLVYDGAAMIWQLGRPEAEGPRFVFTDDVVVTDAVVDLTELRTVRAEAGSWREAARRSPVPPDTSLPACRPCLGSSLPSPVARYSQALDPAPPDPSLVHHQQALGRTPGPSDVGHLELELALCLGLRDYLVKSRVAGCAVALSGGRDSAMVALLVARMLRHAHPDDSAEAHRQRVRGALLTAWLGTTNSSLATRHASAAFAEAIGATHHDLSVQPLVDALHAVGSDVLGRPLSWDVPREDLAAQNLQARARSGVIWLLANLRGFLLLTTSNLSEAAVGYATMDGDTSGGLAPLGGVPKTLVIAWLEWARDVHRIPALDAVLLQPPTAELRPPERAQTDEGDLMPYAVLDALIVEAVQVGREPLSAFQHLWPAVRERYQGDARAFARHVRRFYERLCASQWKRERLAISFRVCALDVDPSAGFRFPAVQSAYVEELAELDRFVEGTFPVGACPAAAPSS